MGPRSRKSGCAAFQGIKTRKFPPIRLPDRRRPRVRIRGSPGLWPGSREARWTRQALRRQRLRLAGIDCRDRRGISLQRSLSITLDPRPDHAAYRAGWLTVLKSDQKAIFTAPAMAQKAVDWLGAKSHPDLGKMFDLPNHCDDHTKTVRMSTNET